MFNKMAARTAAGLLLAGVALAGCAHKDSLVGTWNGTNTTPQGGTLKMTMQFMQDGKESLTSSASGGPISITMTASGTYTADGSTLSQSMTSISMNGRNMPVPASSAKTEVAQYKLDGDTLTITNPGNASPVVLTRQPQ